MAPGSGLETVTCFQGPVHSVRDRQGVDLGLWNWLTLCGMCRGSILGWLDVLVVVSDRLDSSGRVRWQELKCVVDVMNYAFVVLLGPWLIFRGELELGTSIARSKSLNLNYLMVLDDSQEDPN